MSAEVLLLGGFCASWLVCGCVGWVLRGWADDERYRRVPEHPSLRYRSDWQRPLRVLEGGKAAPYNWETDEWRDA